VNDVINSTTIEKKIRVNNARAFRIEYLLCRSCCCCCCGGDGGDGGGGGGLSKALHKG
jgi:hypothetical protein